MLAFVWVYMKEHKLGNFIVPLLTQYLGRRDHTKVTQSLKQTSLRRVYAKNCQVCRRHHIKLYARGQ